MTDEACDGYAELIGLSECDFVEIKGATLAPVWDKPKSGLSFDSMPLHDEVRAFAERLGSRLPRYGLACEHKHSSCVLLGRRDRFFEPHGRWHTWIDFEAFADAAIAGTPMEVTDFALETPSWALASDWGTASRASSQVGFDPNENRQLRRKARSVEKQERRKSLPPHKMMGDVAVLGLEEGLVAEAAAEKLLRLSHVRSVVVYEPAEGGAERGRNSVRHIAGDPNLEITYKEWGVSFKLDLAKRLSRLSRSQGGCDERKRICDLVQPGERVLVLGSGMGLTACLVARHTKCREVIGVERDPVAHEFALDNIQANKLGDRARSVLGDPYTFDLKSLGVFDRVCAFLPFRRDRDGEVIPLSENMALGVQVLAPGGTLTCYNHETQEEFTSEPEQANRSMAVACDGRGFELTWRGKVPRSSIGRNWYRVGMDYRLTS